MSATFDDKKSAPFSSKRESTTVNLVNFRAFSSPSLNGYPSFGLFSVHNQPDSKNHDFQSPSFLDQSTQGEFLNDNHWIEQEEKNLFVKRSPSIVSPMSPKQRCSSALVSKPPAGTRSLYRPNSSHQYLTPIELRDSTIAEVADRLGKPTRTTLLRDRLRRRSLSSIIPTPDYKKSHQKPIRSTFGSLTDLLGVLAAENNESPHGFLTGARYNRSDFIEQLVSRDQIGQQVLIRKTPPPTLHSNSLASVVAVSPVFPDDSGAFWLDETESSSSTASDSVGKSKPVHVVTLQFGRPLSALRRTDHSALHLGSVPGLENHHKYQQHQPPAFNETKTVLTAVASERARPRTAVGGSRQSGLPGIGRLSSRGSQLMCSSPSVSEQGDLSKSTSLVKNDDEDLYVFDENSKSNAERPDVVTSDSHNDDYG